MDSDIKTEMFRMDDEDVYEPLAVGVSFQNDSGVSSCIGSPIKEKDSISFLEAEIALNLNLANLCHNEEESSNQIKGSDKIGNRQQDLNDNDLSLETDEGKATEINKNATQNQHDHCADSILLSKSTVEDISDSVEMESGYYSGHFHSFSSIIDEESNISDLAPINEIQSSTDTESNNQFLLSISNRNPIQSNIDCQSNEFSLEKTFETNLEQPNLRPISVLSDISEENTYHATSEEIDTALVVDSTKECYNEDGNYDLKPYYYDSSYKDSDMWLHRNTVNRVSNVVSPGTLEFEQMEKAILGTSNEYNYSPFDNTDGIDKCEAFQIEQDNEEVKISEKAKLNPLIPKRNVINHVIDQPQIICFSNGGIKSTYSKRRGTKHLRGLQRLTTMLKQPSNPSIQYNPMLKQSSKPSIQNNERNNSEVLNLKNVQKIEKRVLQSFSEIVESSRISFSSNIPGNNAEDLPCKDRGFLSLIINETEHFPLSELHALNKENSHPILKEGYSHFRECVLTVSNEAENNEQTESLITRILRSMNRENLKQFAFLILAFMQHDAKIPYFEVFFWEDS